MPEDWATVSEQARGEYAKATEKRDKIVLLLCDDPAAVEAAGRLRANWESLGAPVEIRQNEGPLMLSLEADAVLLAVRNPSGGEGVLPECLALIDRSGWWETKAFALGDKANLLRNVRNLDPKADLGTLGSAMQDAGLAIPLASYDILFCPGPDVTQSPGFVYPGPALWRAYKGGGE